MALFMALLILLGIVLCVYYVVIFVYLFDGEYETKKEFFNALIPFQRVFFHLKEKIDELE